MNPSKKLIVPNDRISKKLFNLTSDDLQEWIEQHKAIDFVELQKHKRFGEIVSPIKLSVEDETFTISEPLDQYHCAVLCTGISELYVGNHQTTPGIIYRAITGKVNRGSEAEPSIKQRDEILGTVGKLKVNKRGSKQNKIAEAESQFIVSSGDVAIILNPLKKTFDKVALLIEFGVKGVLHLEIDLVGNANSCPALLKVRADIIARVSTLCKNFFALKFDSCK